MRYLEMTKAEYKKYQPLLERMGVIAFANSLPDVRPLQTRKDLILKWEKEMGV